MSDILVDSSFLVALSFAQDKNHTAAYEYMSTSQNTFLIPDVTIPEVAYVLRRAGGLTAIGHFGTLIASLRIPLLSLTDEDLQRAIGLMMAYKDANLDIVDCCITAIAERLNITSICTFDRRDFAMIRPEHRAYFDLFP